MSVVLIYGKARLRLDEAWGKFWCRVWLELRVAHGQAPATIDSESGTSNSVTTYTSQSRNGEWIRIFERVHVY